MDELIRIRERENAVNGFIPIQEEVKTRTRIGEDIDAVCNDILYRVVKGNGNLYSAALELMGINDNDFLKECVAKKAHPVAAYVLYHVKREIIAPWTTLYIPDDRHIYLYEGEMKAAGIGTTEHPEPEWYLFIRSKVYVPKLQKYIDTQVHPARFTLGRRVVWDANPEQLLAGILNGLKNGSETT